MIKHMAPSDTNDVPKTRAKHLAPEKVTPTERRQSHGRDDSRVSALRGEAHLDAGEEERRMKAIGLVVIMTVVMVPLLVDAGQKAGKKPAEKPKVESKEESGLHRFFLDYAVMDHSLKGDQGETEKLMALLQADQENDTQTAKCLAGFWHQRAIQHCDAWVQKSIKRHIQALPEQASEKQKDAVMTKVWKDVEPCLHSYYYDHWEEINQTIRNRYETARREDHEKRKQ
jgi:hypothetical protein